MAEKGEMTDEQVAYVDSSRNIAVAMGEEDLKTLLTKQKKFCSSWIWNKIDMDSLIYSNTLIIVWYHFSISGNRHFT